MRGDDREWLEKGQHGHFDKAWCEGVSLVALGRKTLQAERRATYKGTMELMDSTCFKNCLWVVWGKVSGRERGRRSAQICSGWSDQRGI